MIEEYRKWLLGGIAIGMAIGYVIAVLTLDQFYKHLMKMVIDEIRDKYCKCLDIIKKGNING